LATRDRELNRAILAGDILNAFENFYATDMVMQENDSEPFTGKDVNRKRERGFVNSVDQFQGATLVGGAVNGDLSYSGMGVRRDVRGGARTKLQQVAARRWKTYQLVHERFYYKGGQ
jgi:hypothetical protein